MQIRLATDEDAPELWKLAEEFLASQVKLGASDQGRALAFGMAYGIRNREAIVLAEEDGRLLGFVAWSGLPNADKREAIGLGTYVIPSARMRGISEQMREFAKRHLKEMGYSFVTTTVRDGNAGGLVSARNSGGRIVGYVVEWKL